MGCSRTILIFSRILKCLKNEYDRLWYGKLLLLGEIGECRKQRGWATAHFRC